MTIPVVWLSYHENVPHRGYWDQALVEDLLHHRLWKFSRPFDFTDVECPNGLEMGEFPVGIVIFNGAAHKEDAAKIKEDILSHFRSCLVMITEDEESLFPWKELEDERIKIWVQTPRLDKHGEGKLGYLPVGYRPSTREVLNSFNRGDEPPFEWFFAGQVTHQKRQDCVAALRKVPGGLLVETDRFAAGLSDSEYYRLMLDAKIAPCPSGATTPDSFRLYEALEAGVLPVVDYTTSNENYPGGYWEMLFGEACPFPVIEKWSDFSSGFPLSSPFWKRDSNKTSAWWMNYKYLLALELNRTLWKMDADNDGESSITVLIPTSPIPTHPSTEIIEETLDSIREQLPEAEIFIMIDGIREEQEDRRADYEEYIRRLIRLCNFSYTNVLPIIMDEHLHQAAMTLKVIKEYVTTPQILFVEHDTPLAGKSDWYALSNAITSGEAHVIRFLHETHVLADHQYLMLDTVPKFIEDCPLLRTIQWSQRPHLASTMHYWKMLEENFTPESRTMIEDVMHGVVQSAYHVEGEAGWEKYKLWIYAPIDIKRSRNLDGRGADPKYPMTP